MDRTLRAFAIRREQTERGLEADVIVVEPNGDVHRISCVCAATGTEIGADGPIVPYLDARYGNQVFCGTVRRAVTMA